MAILEISEITELPKSETTHSYHFPDAIGRLGSKSVGQGIAVRFKALDDGKVPDKEIQRMRNDLGAFKRATGKTVKTKLDKTPSKVTGTNGDTQTVYSLHILITAEEHHAPEPTPAQ